MIWKHLRALAFQFPEIDEVEPRFNGSCRRFAGVVDPRTGVSWPGATLVDGGRQRRDQPRVSIRASQ